MRTRSRLALTIAVALSSVAFHSSAWAQNSTDVPAGLADLLAAQALAPTGDTGQPIAIYKVQGNDPWFGENKNESTLQGTFGLTPGAGYDVRDTIDLSTGIPLTTRVIILPGNGFGNAQQTNEINAAAAQANLLSFVMDGGCLYANLADNQFGDGYSIPGMLGKADDATACTGTTITPAGAGHPITLGLDGVPSGDDLTQTNVDASFWGFCSDNHGALTGILPGSASILWTEQGGAQRPVLAEYPLGSGSVVVHTRPIEFFADGQIVIDNMLNYAVSLSQTCSRNEPPECSDAFADPDRLWPPNHKFHNVSIEGVTDPEGDPFSIVIDGISQDEPVNEVGDGNTTPDAGGVDTGVAQVRAERSGTLDGRVYHVSFTAEDDGGGSCSGAVTVCVPHDESDAGCQDQGPLFDSTGSGVVGPIVEVAIRHDVSLPLRDLLAPARPARLAAGGEEGVELPLRVPESAPAKAEAQAAVSPAATVSPAAAAAPAAAVSSTPPVSLDFEGLSDDDNAAVVGFRLVPPDTEGDIGPNHYVQWINIIFQIWDITRDANGDPISATPALPQPQPGNAIWSGFGGFCQFNNDGDPIVVYDHLADRWLLSQFSVNQGIQCVALSQTPDPTGPYFRWAFLVSPGEANDYPKFGVMPDAYYLSLRDFPSFNGLASAVAFDRAAMLAGAVSPTFVKFSLPCLFNDCVDGFQPPHLEGPPPAAGTPGIFTKVWDDDLSGPVSGADGTRLWRFVPDFGNPPASTFVELPIVLSSANFDSDMCGFFNRNCIPQKSSSQRLDPIDELQMYRAQYRHWGTHDSLLVNSTVDATGTDVAGIYWAELRNSGGGWSLHQDGTYAPADGENRWMGSIAMDSAGNIALGYSVSSASTDPSIRYTTRESDDPAGTLPGGEVEVISGGGAQVSSTRWGDYSTMSVDPVADCTFWYTQEYYANTGSFDFKTRIAAFKMPNCGVLEIEIDVKPGNPINPVNLSSKGVIPVAILGSETFDVSDVDVTTLAFGPAGASIAHRKGPHPSDSNHDGIPDLLAHFLSEETGILPGDTQPCVTGETLDGTVFEGCDAVRMVPPK